jgi:hypothetical protein
MVVVVEFTIVMLSDQLRCVSMTEGIKKMWNVYTVEFSPAIRKNEQNWRSLC